MSKRLVSRLLGMFQSRTQVGVDKTGNRYFTRVEDIDGASLCPHPFPAFYLLARPSDLSSALDLLWKEDGAWMLANKQILVLLFVPPFGGTVKEKRWVEFKGADQEPTTVPVEWICWLNGQRKKAPTPEELAELEERHERVKQNIELLKKKEEEERKAGVRPIKKIGKADSPNLQSFVKQQYRGASPDQKKGPEEVSRPDAAADTEDATTNNERSSEPTGTGATFMPGTWQPPT